jgi:hypothetical protein
VLKNIDGYKTYIVASLAIVYALSGLVLGLHDQTTAIEMILAALGMSTIRHKMVKSK